MARIRLIGPYEVHSSATMLPAIPSYHSGWVGRRIADLQSGCDAGHSVVFLVPLACVRGMHQQREVTVNRRRVKGHRISDKTS